MAGKSYRIVVADDEEGIRLLLGQYLQRQGYDVACVSNGVDALEEVARRGGDLVLSDIRMPVMDGFALFERLSADYPHVKRVLMTSYDIDEYMTMIRRHNIGNIFPKDSTFEFTELSRHLESLLTEEIFGLHRWFFEGRSIQCRDIHSEREAQEVCDEIGGACSLPDQVLLTIATNELLSNAVFHGILGLTQVPRDQWPADYEIPQPLAPRICWVHDGEKLGVSVEDCSGTLRKTDVLKWFEDPFRNRPTVGREHGRGLVLVRGLIDRFIVNISPARRTECILIQYFDRRRKPDSRPLMVREI